jgi:RNA polymerase sigma-70 factor, ECF subfamily
MDTSVSTDSILAEETALIDCIVSGQSSKFEVLIGNYQQRIFGTLLGMLGSRQDAEDVAQETFITAFRKLDQFEHRSSFYTWLHRIAFNAAIDLQRRKKRAKNQFVSRDSLEISEPADRQSESPATIVMAKETVAQVQLALSRLDEERRNIIVLRDLQGIDYAEIAAMLDIPLGTVRSRLHRARIELREIMSAMGIGDCPLPREQSAINKQMVAQGRNQE